MPRSGGRTDVAGERLHGMPHRGIPAIPSDDLAYTDSITTRQSEGEDHAELPDCASTRPRVGAFTRRTHRHGVREQKQRADTAERR